jgi:CRISPR/Cas system CSM-associated protein Csm3 (group 7 of RAMP superfamily)
MSLGLGKFWLDKHAADVYPSDEVVINGKKFRPPKYYDIKFKAINPDDFENIKIKRIAKLEEYAINNTADRLAVREKVLISRMSSTKNPVDVDIL